LLAEYVNTEELDRNSSTGELTNNRDGFIDEFLMENQTQGEFLSPN